MYVSYAVNILLPLGIQVPSQKVIINIYIYILYSSRHHGSEAAGSPVGCFGTSPVADSGGGRKSTSTDLLLRSTAVMRTNMGTGAVSKGSFRGLMMAHAMQQLMMFDESREQRL